MDGWMDAKYQARLNLLPSQISYSYPEYLWNQQPTKHRIPTILLFIHLYMYCTYIDTYYWNYEEKQLMFQTVFFIHN